MHVNNVDENQQRESSIQHVSVFCWHLHIFSCSHLTSNLNILKLFAVFFQNITGYFIMDEGGELKNKYLIKFMSNMVKHDRGVVCLTHMGVKTEEPISSNKEYFRKVPPIFAALYTVNEYPEERFVTLHYTQKNGQANIFQTT